VWGCVIITTWWVCTRPEPRAGARAARRHTRRSDELELKALQLAAANRHMLRTRMPGGGLDGGPCECVLALALCACACCRANARNTLTHFLHKPCQRTMHHVMFGMCVTCPTGLPRVYVRPDEVVDPSTRLETPTGVRDE
jgi:hypothetical protein